MDLFSFRSNEENINKAKNTIDTYTGAHAYTHTRSHSNLSEYLCITVAEVVSVQRCVCTCAPERVYDKCNRVKLHHHPYIHKARPIDVDDDYCNNTTLCQRHMHTHIAILPSLTHTGRSDKDSWHGAKTRQCFFS